MLGTDSCLLYAWHTPSFAHADNSLLLSWGFHRQGRLLWKRFDRFYVGHFEADSGGTISILLGTSLSDHAPVSLCVLSRRSSAPCRSSRILDSVLQDTSLRTALSQIWTYGHLRMQDPAVYLASCIDTSSTACRHLVSERSNTAATSDGEDFGALSQRASSQ
ncbi:hypothetical protein L7F22_045229 [Adiantum nelumboides]|nr:hypothetical protein [Adiantum nelumboides]